jgi:hypothetical protein
VILSVKHNAGDWHPGLAFRLNGYSAGIGCAQWLFPACVVEIFHGTKIGSYIRSGIAGPALV